MIYVTDDNFDQIEITHLTDEVLLYDHQHNIRFSYRSNPSLKYVKHGSVNYVINGRHVSLKKGDFLFVNGSQNVETIITAPVKGISIFLNDHSFIKSDVISHFPICDSQLKNQLNTIMFSQVDISLFEIRWRISQYLDELHNSFDRLGHKTNEGKSEALRKVLIAKNHIDCHPKSYLSMDELAQTAFLSKHELIRRFKEVFSITPYKYHQQLKIRATKKELRSEKTLHEIALEYNIADIHSYSKLFKKIVGIPPSQYRIQLKTEQFLTKEVY